MNTSGTLHPSTVRRAQSLAGGCKYSVDDVLLQLMPAWTFTDRRNHLTEFRARYGQCLFEKAYIPSKLHENKRKIANVDVASLQDIVRLICSLPGDASHLFEQATAMQRDCGGEPLKDLKHEPLCAQPQQLLPQSATRQIQPARKPSEVYSAALTTIPPGATTVSGNRYQYNSHTIHVLLDVHGSPWFRGLAIAEALEYPLPKEALKEFVSRQRTRKRETLPMTTTMSRVEREAKWICVEGVRDLAESCNHCDGKAFLTWLSSTILVKLRGPRDLSFVTVAPSQQLEQASQEVLTNEAIANTRLLRQSAVLGQQISHVTLALMAYRFSKELGVTLPATLEPEYLLQVASAPPDPQPNLTNKELQQISQETEQVNLAKERLRKKAQRLELAIEARRLANLCGLGVSEAQLLAERQAIEAACTPSYLDDEGWFTAGDYLRTCRGHSEDEVQQLQTSFGKHLKKFSQEVCNRTPDVTQRDYGRNEHITCLYHASRDRALLNAGYQTFTLTDLYRRVVPPSAQAINTL